jgi:hypothetical protein
MKASHGVIRTALLAIVVAATIQVNGAQQVPAIDSLMTAADFRAAGLQKLTPEELSILNGWLAKYTMSVVAAIRTPQTANPTAAASVIESQIEGDFEGWDGETIFKLNNGQIWQQASYAYTYHYAYRPKVLVYRSGSTYRMKVDGVSSDIAVKRLK